MYIQKTMCFGTLHNRKRAVLMRRLTSRNVGFVGVLSCLVLMLALFFSTSVASAHSTQATVHSQTSVTSVSTLKGESKGPYQTCKTVSLNGQKVKVCQKCNKAPSMKQGGRRGGSSGQVKSCRYYTIPG
jgi:hypothetical protein